MYDSSVIDLKLDTDNPYFSATNSDGYIVLYFILGLLNTNMVSQFVLLVKFDDSQIYSDIISIT